MPITPTTERGLATRQRVLAAATQEFAERGIAGARIDRITSAARTNKAQVYAYFGSKDGLFDAVIADSVHRITSAAPFDGGNLWDWAVQLYDANVEHPELVRLSGWFRLERRPTGMLFDNDDHRPKLEAIAQAQAAGTIRAGDPFDIIAMVIAAACTWSPVSGIYTASVQDPESDHERRRTLLREFVRAALTKS
ncbi:TetR family transcriptional regulator [Microlunatus endophyticus]|uniref:TetR family transcriptional regulator n=1 Tax=Microlunatus endophyticus TaxID=1716077 RepID=A0A917SBF1_9ACTN|nr:TetR family transcriptional regulator [Microlunatus endophyticus]GGL67479.1 TetR family transcriptional regulator [Microlunatus endophyticus]